MYDDYDKDDKTQYTKLFCLTWVGDAEVCREMRNNNKFDMGTPYDTHWDNAGRYWVVYNVETSMSLSEVRKWEEEILTKLAPMSTDEEIDRNEVGKTVTDDETLDAMELRGEKVKY